MKTNNAYFPISLGNHYYSNDILISIKDSISIHHEKSLVLICDHLRYLSYKLKGLSNEVIDEKIQKEVREFKARLANCGYNYSNIKTETMSSYLDNTVFVNLQKEIQNLIYQNKLLFDYLNNLSLLALDKNNNTQESGNKDIQIQYFISETSLSIYITEVLGYENEYYKQLDRGLIVILYEKYERSLEKIIEQNKLNRKFRPLTEVLS